MISSMGGYRCCHIQFWNMVIMEKEKRYVASISGGKDSMAMVLGLMEKGWGSLLQSLFLGILIPVWSFHAFGKI